MWWVKFVICVVVDLLDFFVGRHVFQVPLAGELAGMVVTVALFGPGGFAYAVEALDTTEQIDGFLPMASLIALAHRRDPVASQSFFHPAIVARLPRISL